MFLYFKVPMFSCIVQTEQLWDMLSTIYIIEFNELLQP